MEITLENLRAQGVISNGSFEELKAKKQLEKDLTMVFANQKNYLSVESVEFKKFYNTQEKYFYEVVKVNYYGGAYAIRNNSCNSVSATLENFISLLNGGYYNEVKTYESILKDKNFVEVQF